jgi:hypothetical protein
MRLGWLCLVLLAAPAMAQMSPPVPPANPPAHCTAAEYHQFDFWIGEWRVFRTSKPDEMVGGSKIVSVHNGCGILESWQPFTLNTGGSLSSFDRATGKWRQTWIDSTGGRGEFSGGLVDGVMVLTGPWSGYGGPDKDALIRMTFSQIDGGAVRQLGEKSRDGGTSWTSAFDFTYRPKPKTE